MALTVTEIMAPTANAATSSIFEVADKPVTVIAKSATKIAKPYSAVLQIEGGAVMQDVFEKGRDGRTYKVVLGNVIDGFGHQICLTSPGEYCIVKAASAESIGFETRTPA